MTELAVLEIEPRSYKVPSWELGVRYIAAYMCMALAVSAAWPLLRAPFGPLLLLIIGVGLPLSLKLRFNSVRFRGRPLNRLMLSSVILFLTLGLSVAFVSSVVDLAAFGGGLWSAMMIFSAGRSVELMIGVFLIFGVCRCLFILSDKDAFLCTLPSFAVLFLLIVVQREPIIVLDFIGWTLMTATLLALDHRQESRRGLSGFVSANAPGQDVRLSARSLATILIISLSCSIALSYTLAAGDPNNRSAFESFLRLVIGGLNSVSGDNSSNTEAATQSEPQSIIDYRSGPPLPTRTVLWKMAAQVWSVGAKVNARDVAGVAVYPTYWRLSSLARYDGAAWLQGIGVSSFRVVTAQPRVETPENFNRRQIRLFDLRSALTTVQRQKKVDKLGDYVSAIPVAPGKTRIEQILSPAVASSGSVPLPVLPDAQFTVKGGSDKATLRTGGEGTVTLSETHLNRQIVVVSDVTPVPEYGGNSSLNNGTLPLDPHLKMSDRARRFYLQLPKMPVRVLELARRLSRGEREPLRQAQKIAFALPQMATYTLRPPNLPDERDATDFFLFDSRRGYCTHFAGALTVLCRELGIPARVVSGFASVERETAEDGRPTGYIIARSSNAHAWTEIWLDGIGWVPLDATPADDRGDNSPTVWGDLSDRFSSAMAALWISMQAKSALWIGGFGLLLLFALAALSVSKRLHERNLARGLAKRLFGMRLGKRAGGQAETSQEVQADLETRATIFSTYNKTTKKLARCFRPRAGWQTPHDWLHDAQTELQNVDLTPLQTLTDLHRRAMYNPQLFSETERQSVREIQNQIKRHKYVAAK